MSQPTLLTIPDQGATGPVDYGEGVTFEWVEEGRIAVMKISGSTRGSVDIFVSLNVSFVQRFAGRKVYILYDATAKGITLTPYMRQRLTALGATYRESGVSGYSAAVVQKGFFSTIAMLFGNLVIKATRVIDTRFFNEYDEALAWLKAQLPD